MNSTSHFENLFACRDGIQEGQIEYRRKEALLKYQIKYTNQKLLVYGTG